MNLKTQQKIKMKNNKSMTIMINEPVTHSKFSTGENDNNKLFYPKTNNTSILI